jgi:valyl-tRNA synthetase
VEFSEDGGQPIASVAGVELLETEGVDPEAVAARIEERREKLRAEVKRGEGKLSNEGFVAKAPADVVDAEREKLAAYRAELEELGG